MIDPAGAAKADGLKRAAAEAALRLVADGMRLGLGSGSTATAFVRLLGQRVAEGLSVVGVPTSERTAAVARQAGVPLTTLDAEPQLHLAIDGADEIGPGLALVKGGGGALLREKIVASAARDFVVIADEGKVVPVLGAFPLPIEVVEFGLAATRIAVEHAASKLGLSGAVVERQRSGQVFVTDGGNRILDASFGRIPDPEALAASLARIPGVVEHGLFLGIASRAFVASPQGVREMRA